MANPNSTTNLSATIDWALNRLEAQWTIKSEFKQAKGEALEALAKQVGDSRFRIAVTRAINHHTSNFCPTIAQIRLYVPDKNQGIEWQAPNPPLNCERVNVFALVRQIAEKHDMGRDGRSKQQVAEAWLKWQKAHHMVMLTDERK